MQRLSQLGRQLHSTKTYGGFMAKGKLSSGGVKPVPEKAALHTLPRIQGDETVYVPDKVNRHNMNPTYFLPRAAEIEPNAKAYIHKGADGVRIERSYGEMADRVLGLATYFKSKEFKRVAICGPNTPAHLETMFGAVASGAYVLGLNYRLTMGEITYKMELGDADCVVVDREFVHLISPEIRSKVEVIVDDDVSGVPQAQNPGEILYSEVVKQGQQLAKDKKTTWDNLHVQNEDEDEILGLFYTSGTTGKPKAVEYTHRSVYLCSLSNIIEAGLNCETVDGHNRCHYLWTLPLFHAAGWTFPYSVTAVRGTHVLLRKIEPDYIWDLLVDDRITHFNAAPTVNNMLVNNAKARRLPQTVRVTVAASPPSAALFNKMFDLNLHPVHMYGLTESYGPFVRNYFLQDWHTTTGDERFALMARQGFAFVGSQSVQVIANNDIAQPVARNGQEIGEIVCRGNAVMARYHKDPEATAKAFEQGWFHTGDLAVVNPDGSIKILDRKKDIIISGGENISSVAVEGIICKYDNVLEVAVVGIPDEKYGEVPKAFLILKDKSKPFSKEAMIAWMRERMGAYQIPRQVAVVDDLPRTSTGKIKKNVLRDSVQA
ncbi:Acetate/butyrate--CoA ligase AAE7, peroxisomal [Yarrowia sp. B02]|nr:Acetate/butyrate--CoA ligase AAE7, peroxisomal [Yarrowia sp. B02]